MRKNLKKIINNIPSLCSDFAGYRETGLSQGDFMRKPLNLPISETGGDKLIHGSGGNFPAAGGLKLCHL